MDMHDRITSYGIDWKMIVVWMMISVWVLEVFIVFYLFLLSLSGGSQKSFGSLMI